MEPPARMLLLSVTVQVLLEGDRLEQLTFAKPSPKTLISASPKMAPKTSGRMTIREHGNMLILPHGQNSRALNYLAG